MDAYTPTLIYIGLIVAAIITLRVFFTLWGPIDRKFSGQDKLDATKHIGISALKDSRVNVWFKSGRQLPNVKIEGYCSTHQDGPYDFKQLLVLSDVSGRSYYARISEVEYIEQNDRENVEPC